MNHIEQLFLKHKDRILKAPLPLKEATEVMYEAIHDRVRLLASKTQYNCKYLILVGAILINGDHDMGSFTEARAFDVLDIATGKMTDCSPLFAARVH